MAATSSPSLEFCTAIDNHFQHTIRFAYPEWRSKAVMLRFDDGSFQDRELIAMMNRYGVKGSFYLSSQRLGKPKKNGEFVRPEEIAALYEGHEIGAHGTTHISVKQLTEQQLKDEILADKIALEKLCGRSVRGFAFPYSLDSEDTCRFLAKNGFTYATSWSGARNHYSLPENRMLWNPTVWRNMKENERLQEYLQDNRYGIILTAFYVGSHSYELDELKNGWEDMEKMCVLLAEARESVWNPTNLEFFDYLDALTALKTSADSSMAQNLSATTLYLLADGKRIKLAPGEMLFLETGKDPRIEPAPAISPFEAPTDAPDGTVFFPGGLRKALTFSYDDGHLPDRKLLAIFDKYQVKATFNLPAHFLLNRMKADKDWDPNVLYKNHEIATHGLVHDIYCCITPSKIVSDIFMDRVILEKITGRLITGHAYPNGTATGGTPIAREIIKQCGLVYGRGTRVTGDFSLPEDFILWEQTAHHSRQGDISVLADRFLAEPTTGDLKVCAIWGHAHEFEMANNFHLMENFCEKLAGKPDQIWYATNLEICEYVTASRKIIAPADGKSLTNPTAIPLYIAWKGKIQILAPGKTLR